MSYFLRKKYFGLPKNLANFSEIAPESWPCIFLRNLRRFSFSILPFKDILKENIVVLLPSFRRLANKFPHVFIFHFPKALRTSNFRLRGLSLKLLQDLK
jgi:hypothetical protein